MSSTEAAGRQSPAPEDQSNAQVGQPAGGQGTDSSENKASNNNDDLNALSSNPKGPLDDAVKDSFTKTQETPINK